MTLGLKPLDLAHWIEIDDGLAAILREKRRLLAERHGILGLSLIVNEKPIDPQEPTSPRVIQLETAMGAAVGVFPGARALHVPRGRLVPVKTTSDLLALWSDAYDLGDDFRIVASPRRLYAGPLASFPAATVANLPAAGALPPGTYVWFIAVDADTNGVMNATFFDYLVTTIGSPQSP